MVTFDSVEGLDVLPRRIFLEGEQRPEFDDDGFVRPSGESLLAEDLLPCTAVLVAAPPWTGKSFVAKQLEASLKVGAREGAFCSPDFVERTCFEERAPRLRPLWWDPWKDGDQRACWIVDAVDEDERQGRDQAYRILDLIEGPSGKLEGQTLRHLFRPHQRDQDGRRKTRSALRSELKACPTCRS